jgi:WD40 repeat protein
VAERLIRLYKQETGVPYPRQKPKALELRADSLNNKAVSLLDLGQEEEAVRCWQEALQADPAHLEANFNYGYYRWHKAELPGSRFLEEFKALEARHQSRQEYWDMLGWIYLEQGDVKNLEQLRDKVKDMLSIFSDSQYPQIQEVKDIELDMLLEENITCLAFSENEQFVLVGSSSGAICLIDIWSGLKLRIYHQGCTSVKISKDGARAISAGFDGCLRLWDLSDGHEIRCICIGESQPISPREITYYDPIAQKETKVYQKVLRPQSECYVYFADFCFSETCVFAVVSVNESWKIQIWDLGTGLLVYEKEIIDGNIAAVSLSEPWVLLGSKTCYDKKTKAKVYGKSPITLWNLESRSRTFAYKLDQEIQCLNISPCGRYILYASDKEIGLLDIQKGEELLSLFGHKWSVDVVIFYSPKIGLSAGHNEAILWDLTTGTEIRRIFLPFDSSHRTLMEVRSNYVVFAHWTRLVIWRFLYPLEWRKLQPYPYLVRPKEPKYQVTHSLNLVRQRMEKAKWREAYNLLRDIQSIPEYQRDPKIIAQISHCGSHGKRLRVRDAWLIKRQRVEGSVEDLIITESAAYALVYRDSELVTIDLHDWQERHYLKGHTYSDECGEAKFSPDGRYVLSISKDNNLRVWCLDDQSLVFCEGHKDKKGFTLSATAIAVAPDSNFIIVASSDGILKFIRIPACKEILRMQIYKSFTSSDGRTTKTHPRNTTRIEALSLTPDIRYAICNGGHGMQIVDLAKRKIIPIPIRVIGLRVSPDGRFILCASSEKNDVIANTVLLLSMANMKDLKKDARRLDSSSTRVGVLGFLSDSRYALTQSQQGLSLWEIETGTAVWKFNIHKEWINSIAISPDNHSIAYSCYGGDIHIWALDWDYDFPDPADWDEGARPYLDIFLTLHTPYGPDGLSRVGKPQWTEEDFQKLLQELGYRGYGWLRPEGVRRELEKMAKERS